MVGRTEKPGEASWRAEEVRKSQPSRAGQQPLLGAPRSGASPGFNTVDSGRGGGACWTIAGPADPDESPPSRRIQKQSLGLPRPGVSQRFNTVNSRSGGGESGAKRGPAKRTCPNGVPVLSQKTHPRRRRGHQSLRLPRPGISQASTPSTQRHAEARAGPISPSQAKTSPNGAPVLSKRTPLCKKKPAPQARDAGNSKWRIGGSNP